MNVRTPPSAREIALEALARVDDGAYANIALPALLNELDSQFELEDREKHFATELTYGTVRMRRACDWLVQRFITRDTDDETLRVLHLGAYQLVFLKTPPHAAVSEMVHLSPNWSKKFVNFCLRRVAEDVNPRWPDLATELSYPDWIVRALTSDLGPQVAREILEAMNQPATLSVRDDGYIQDPASQMVAQAVGAQSGERILDLCAAPGGKATFMASQGAFVTAVDIHEHRGTLIAANVDRLGLGDHVEVRVGDATTMEFEPGSYDRVLVDAPCSGLGSLRRRPDARWRMDEKEIVKLVKLQRALMSVAADAVKPGGVVVYSACTLTRPESLGLDDWVAEHEPGLMADARIAEPGWEPIGSGARLLPGETDGMVMFRYRRSVSVGEANAGEASDELDMVPNPVANMVSNPGELPDAADVSVGADDPDVASDTDEVPAITDESTDELPAAVEPETLGE